MASVSSAAHVMAVVRASQVERQVRSEHRSVAGQGSEKLYGFIHRRRPFICDLGRTAMGRVVVHTCVALNPVFKEGSKCDGVRSGAKYSRVYVYCQRACLLVVRHGSLRRRRWGILQPPVAVALTLWPTRFRRISVSVDVMQRQLSRFCRARSWRHRPVMVEV